MVRVTVKPVRTVLSLVLVAVAATSACGTTARDRPGESAGGPHWRTSVRSGVGAASTAHPARLTGIDVQEHDEFDRISLGFDGKLPGYRVAYSASGTGVLTIDLRHVSYGSRQELDADRPAVSAVRLEPADDESARAVVTTAPGTRLPFRIGFSLDSFYVDVAHPGAA